MSELVIRRPMPGEMRIMMQTYVRESRRMWPQHEQLPDHQRVSLAERFLCACVEAGHVQVCGTRDGAVLAGYALGQRHPGSAVLHWVYVRGAMPYRGHGIARRLVRSIVGDAPDVRVTHSCSKRQRLRIKAEKTWKWAPRLPWTWLLALDETNQKRNSA